MATPEIKIEIDEQVARGVYTNLAFISHSETEFLVDFAFLQPQTPKTKVLTRVVTSPIHAKRLLRALQDNISKYESRFGAIDADGRAGEQGPSLGFYQ